MKPVIASDFIVVGGGMAGASVAYWLGKHGKVTLLEREAQPGYHSSGRSGAMFMEGYGSAQVRALTMASRAFFERPDWGHANHPILTPRGALIIARPDQLEKLDNSWNQLSQGSKPFGRLDQARTLQRVPVLRPEMVYGSIYDGDACDMDVNELLLGYLRAVKEQGGSVVCGAEVKALERVSHAWEVHAGNERYRAPILINAAGAWCDVLAKLAGVAPIGLVPKRRSAFIFAPPAGSDSASWPMCLGVDESWYFKPDAGMLLGSPANADPVEPHDVQAEELDIATGVYAIEQMTSMEIRRPKHVWAGLRSFVADGDLVGGFDVGAPGFFWVAAQGGYGIQTSAAMGEACAALATGRPLPARIADFGLSAAMLSPARLA